MYEGWMKRGILTINRRDHPELVSGSYDRAFKSLRCLIAQSGIKLRGIIPDAEHHNYKKINYLILEVFLFRYQDKNQCDLFL